MTHRWRFPLILLLSMVFGAPVLSKMALASGDLPAAGARYLAALALSWLGVTAIGRMVDSYAADNDHARRTEAAQALLDDKGGVGDGDSDVAADSEPEGAPAPAMS